jgi:hypothetical protein
MNRDFLDYVNLYDAKKHLIDLQNKRREVEIKGDLEELNSIDDEIVNAIILLQRYEIAMG